MKSWNDRIPAKDNAQIKHNVQMQILDLFEKDSNFWVKSQIYMPFRQIGILHTGLESLLKKDIVNLLGEVQKRATKKITGFSVFKYEGRLVNLGLST